LHPWENIIESLAVYETKKEKKTKKNKVEFGKQDNQISKGESKYGTENRQLLAAAANMQYNVEYSLNHRVLIGYLS